MDSPVGQALLGRSPGDEVTVERPRGNATFEIRAFATGAERAVFTKASQRTFARYVAFRVPGWVIAASVAWWLVAKAGLAPWLAVLGCALFVIKDFALYPWVRDWFRGGRTRRGGAARGPHGRRARATRPTSGYVRVGAELWRASSLRAARRSTAGVQVRVRDVRGLTLIVESC